jgi:hypothetical protein
VKVRVVLDTDGSVCTHENIIGIDVEPVWCRANAAIIGASRAEAWEEVAE